MTVGNSNFLPEQKCWSSLKEWDSKLQFKACMEFENWMIIAHCEGINRRNSVTETFPANIRENLRPKEINSIERDQLCSLHGFKN